MDRAQNLIGATAAAIPSVWPVNQFHGPMAIARAVTVKVLCWNSAEDYNRARVERAGPDDMSIRTRAVLVRCAAIAATLLGAAALLLFGRFLWSGSLPLVELRMSDASLLTWDAGLCFLFFLQHSGMIRKSFRMRLSRIWPEYCHGVVYTIASAIVLLLLTVCWQTSAINLYIATGVGRWLAGAVLLLSLGGVAWGVGSLRQFDLFGVETFLAEGRREQCPASKLVVAGPYRLIRHPFYFFTIVALWAAPTFSLDRLLLNCLFTPWIILGARLEERDLLAQFGEDYSRYQLTVPMFVPRLAAGRSHVQQPKHP